MTITVACQCGWTTDLEITSETNPRRCPQCGGEIMLAAMGELSKTPLWVGVDLNPELFDES